MNDLIEEYLKTAKREGFNINNIKSTKVHLIPIKDELGMSTGRIWELKENSEMYHKILKQNNGIFPEHITILRQ